MIVGTSQDSSFPDSKLESLVTLPSPPSDEKFDSMVKSRREHLPKDDYFNKLRNGMLDLSVRNKDLNWISKRDKARVVQLLAVACLSLAAKMEEIKVPLTVDFQVGEPEFLFLGRTMRRMEFLLLSTPSLSMITGPKV